MRDERASATILEFTVVLPLCFIVIASLFLIGFILNRQALLDSAADRAALIIRHSYSDPNYLDIADLGTGEKGADYIGIKNRNSLYGLCKCKPYRFLLGAYDKSPTDLAVSDKVNQIIDKNSVFYGGISLSDVKTEISREGLLSDRVTVTVSQTLEMPVFGGTVWRDPVFMIKASSETVLSSPAEIIRNTDFALDLTEKYTGTDIQKKLSDALSKAVSFASGK